MLSFASLFSFPASAQWGKTLDENDNIVGPAGDSGAAQPLPYFDARYDQANGDLPALFVLDALTEARSGTDLIERQAAIHALQERIPGLRVDDHEFFGTPHFVASPRATLTAPNDMNALEIARQFVLQEVALFELGTDELESARATRNFTTSQTGIQHLTLQQRIRGLDLFGAELRANVAKDGRLINLSSTMLPQPDAGFAVSAVVLTARDALRAAAASVGIDLSVNPEPAGSAFGVDSYQEWKSLPDLRSDETVTTSLVHFPLTRSDIRTAWAVLVPEIGIGNTYEILIDATTGKVLRRWNRLHFSCSHSAHMPTPSAALFGGQQDVSMRVFATNDSPRPGSPGSPAASNAQFPVVSRDFVTVTGSSVQPFSPNGWIDDNDNQTLGNNCDAHTDFNADNQPELPRPQGSPFRVFDFPLDLASAPTVSAEAAVTNLFYLTNVYHDRLYSLGFDEPAGNFQQNNFGNGGANGDRIQADALDGITTGNPMFINNANFGTGGDGSTGRCQMFGWSGPNPDRDGCYDSDIVYHELSHGLSIRLSGVSVFGEQSGGMGEGWGDFFGLALNSEASDPPAANYPMGPYATFRLGNSQANYFFGIRRLPYTTDMSINPLTYADTDPNQIAIGVSVNPILPTDADFVHAVGEIWCSALWECRANMIVDLGHAAANEEIMRLVVDGMKLMPSNPNMLQARDAILQSDMIVNGAANRVALWQGFAKRGLGFSAASPSGSTTTGVFEAFDTPLFLDFTYPNGRPTQLSAFEETTFRVDITGQGSVQPVDGSAVLIYTVDGGPQMTSPLTLLSPGGVYEGALPPVDCFGSVEFFIETDSNFGVVSDPSGSEGYTAVSFENLIVALDDNFQTDQGWQVSTTASDGGWQRGVPQNNGRGDPPVDFDGSGICFLSDNDPNTDNSDIDNGTTALTSPVMDVAGGALISWAYWLNDTSNGELNGNDSLDVEFATDSGGTNWAPLRSYGTALSAWRQDEVTVGVDLPSSSTLRLRFIAKDLDTQNVVETGLDAFSASALECQGLGTPFCFGDGSGTSCPCANNVGAGLQTGCLNSSGGGCRLMVSGEPSASQDTLAFSIESATPTSFGLLVSGDNQLAGGLGIVDFDGLRCVGGNFQRHGSRPTDAFGQSANPWGPPAGPIGGLIAQAGFSVGQTRNFQVFFRETPGMICTTGLNTSSAFRLTIRP